MVKEIKKEKCLNRFFDIDGTLIDLQSIAAVGTVKTRSCLFEKRSYYFCVIFKSGKEISFWGPKEQVVLNEKNLLTEALLNLGEINE